jgi:hypothetical protein
MRGITGDKVCSLEGNCIASARLLLAEKANGRSTHRAWLWLIAAEDRLQALSLYAALDIANVALSRISQSEWIKSTRARNLYTSVALACL